MPIHPHFPSSPTLFLNVGQSIVCAGLLVSAINWNAGKALRFHFGILETGRHSGTQFRVVFDAIRALMDAPEKPSKKIGFERKGQDEVLS